MPYINSFFFKIFHKRSNLFIFSLYTSFFSLIISAILLSIISFAFYQESDSNELKILTDDFFLLKTLLVIPIIENILLALIIDFIKFFSEKNLLIAIFIAISSGLIHGLAHQWMFISGFFLFGTMAYSYLLYNEKSYIKRLSIINTQHIIFNLPVCLVYIFKNI